MLTGGLLKKYAENLQGDHLCKSTVIAFDNPRETVVRLAM
jgi:hypothetical protein